MKKTLAILLVLLISVSALVACGDETDSKKNSKNLIIFIGGDAEYFVNQIKSAIFAGRNVMYSGLNRILEYNAESDKI